jgi:DNA (cytosine-5)-methyltransferase 1
MTHAKNGAGGLKEWLPVGPLLQLDEHGESIFTRTKNLAPNTYKRVFKGVKKFGVKPFISKYYGNGDNVSELTNPCPTLTTKDRCYLTSSFLLNNYINPSYTNVCEPCSTIVTKPQQKLITCFLMSEYSTGRNSEITNPCPTLTTVPKEKLITTHFLLDHQFNNEGSSISQPCPTLIARQDKKPKYLVSSQFLMSTNFNNIGTSLTEPAPTQLASRKYDYLVTADDGVNRSIIQDGDCDEVIQLKMFMQENGISDIKMRPLQVSEMLKIMTFPKEYILKGTKTEQKKYIGNSVPPLAAEKIVEKSMATNI